MNVSGADAVMQGVEAMNQVLQNAQSETMELAEKMVKVTVETALASKPGMGDIIDTQA